MQDLALGLREPETAANPYKRNREKRFGGIEIHAKERMLISKSVPEAVLMFE